MVKLLSRVALNCFRVNFIRAWAEELSRSIVCLLVSAIFACTQNDLGISLSVCSYEQWVET